MATAAGRAAQARLTSRPAWRAAAATAADIALRHLDSACKARRRLKRTADPEALHDFRVALRRLRSVLRAYRPWLDGLPKKQRRRLRAIARATGAGRDAEVCLAWLNTQKNIAPPAHARFQARLARLRDEGYSRVRADALAAFADVEPRLRRRLKAIRRGRPSARTGYAAATADCVNAQVARVAADLARIGDAADTAMIHAARIQAKRLRYLLEPLAEAKLPTARATLNRLKAFQDETGLLCDGFVRRRLIADATADDRDDLAALTALSEADIEERFETVRRRYLTHGTPRFIEQARTIARRLAAKR